MGESSENNTDSQPTFIKRVGKVDDVSPDLQVVPFGREMRQRHFLFEDTFVNLNHGTHVTVMSVLFSEINSVGSFGTYVKSVREKLRQFQDAAEAAPDRFIRYEYPRLLDLSRTAMAGFLGVPVEEVVFVANATTAVNVVLRNLDYQAGDLIVYLDPIYGACEKTISYLTATTPAKALKVEFTLPISDDELVSKFEAVLAANMGKVRIALFETVASLPGVRLPFERLTATAKSHGVLTLIDGAHGVGHLPLNLPQLEPDFFVSNCHKWLFTPRGCAIFYVPKRNQHLMQTSLPTSHYYEPKPQPGTPAVNNPLPPTGKSNFVSQFEFVGSLDNAPYLCVPEALEFRRNICGGEEAIQTYCYDLAYKGGHLVARLLGTEVMDNADHSLTSQCCMVNVRLPLNVVDDGQDGLDIHPIPPRSSASVPRSRVARVTQLLTSSCVSEHATFIAFIFYRDAWWARLSAQIYLSLSDFEYGARVLQALCSKVAEEAY